jgi:acetyl coenzyme A synthetase (ADP forming)-like protein
MSPTAPPPWQKNVILKDGTSLRLRPLRSEDRESLLRFFDRLSPATVYNRFMGFINRPSFKQAERFSDIDYENEMAIAAVLADEHEPGGERIAAVGRFIRLPRPTHAEVAFTVEDAYQGLGIGTHLLQELLPFARMAEVEVVEAEVLAGNEAMLKVFQDMGFAATSQLDHGVVHIEFRFEATELSEERRWAREQAANTRAVERVLRPRSVAVVGASTRRGTIGNTLVRNLLQQEFNGPIYPVNPKHEYVCSVPCHASLAEVPGPVDLVVIAVPAVRVLEIVRECAAKHVYAALVISAGFAETGPGGKHLEDELLDVARRHGMRLVGPNCLGLVNTEAEVALNATFAPTYPPAGRVAFSSQSGALGIAILSLAQELRIGLSQFVSVGNKADISSNDLLYFWGNDPHTNVVLLYMESFGNPRKFSRIARKVSRQKPVVVLKSGSSLAGARAAASHTGALAASPIVASTLFDQAGIIQTDTLEKLFHAAKVLSAQPRPAGKRIAILTNAGGPGILTADRADAEGLLVPELSAALQGRLREHLPPAASTHNPVDMIASATAAHYEACLRELLASDEVDQVAVLFIPPLVTAATDVAQAILRAHQAVPHAKPLVATLMGEDGRGAATESLEAGGVSTFRFPEDAVVALAILTRYRDWREQPPGRVVKHSDVERVTAAKLIAAVTGDDPRQDPRWLPPLEGYQLLRSYGIPVLDTRLAKRSSEAAAIAEELGFPVAVKLASETIAHKTDVHGVFLNLRSTREVRGAFDELRDNLEKLGRLGEMDGVLVQPMAGDGLETVMGMTFDPQFGPVLMCGLGGIFVELFQDVQFALHPVTDRDVANMVNRLRSRRLFDGFRGDPARDLDAFQQTLLRLSQLVEDHPQIRELDLNPVMVKAKGEGCVVTDVRVRVQAVDRFEQFVIAHLDD